MQKIQIYFLALFISFSCENILYAAQSNNNLLLNSPCIINNKHAIKQAEIALSRGVDVNVQDMYGNTTLHKATCRNQYALIQLLIDTQPHLNVNLENKGGNKPLDLAFRHRHPQELKKAEQIIKLLASLDATPGVNFQLNDIPKQLQNTYHAGIQICEQRKKERAAYEQEVANHLDKHIIKDLNNIIGEYNKMNILQFVHMQKEQEQKTEEKNN